MFQSSSWLRFATEVADAMNIRVRDAAQHEQQTVSGQPMEMRETRTEPGGGRVVHRPREEGADETIRTESAPEMEAPSQEQMVLSPGGPGPPSSPGTAPADPSRRARHTHFAHRPADGYFRGNVRNSIQPGAYPRRSPKAGPFGKLAHQPASSSSMEVMGVTPSQSPTMEAAKESALYCTPDLEVPGILTVSKVAVTFEPDPRSGHVASRGIGTFQVYIDMRDILECGAVSVPRSEARAVEGLAPSTERVYYLHVVVRTLDGSARSRSRSSSRRQRGERASVSPVPSRSRTSAMGDRDRSPHPPLPPPPIDLTPSVEQPTDSLSPHTDLAKSAKGVSFKDGVETRGAPEQPSARTSVAVSGVEEPAQEGGLGGLGLSGVGRILGGSFKVRLSHTTGSFLSPLSMGSKTPDKSTTTSPRPGGPHHVVFRLPDKDKLHALTQRLVDYIDLCQKSLEGKDSSLETFTLTSIPFASLATRQSLSGPLPLAHLLPPVESDEICLEEEENQKRAISRAVSDGDLEEQQEREREEGQQQQQRHEAPSAQGAPVRAQSHDVDTGHHSVVKKGKGVVDYSDLPLEAQGSRRSSVRSEMSALTRFDVPENAASLLTPYIVHQISANLPPRLAFRRWSLLYGLKFSGISLQTFYRNLEDKGPCVLLIEDMGGTVFGAYCSEPFRHASKYYGTGETFVFTFREEHAADLQQQLTPTTDSYQQHQLDHGSIHKHLSMPAVVAMSAPSSAPGEAAEGAGAAGEEQEIDALEARRATTKMSVGRRHLPPLRAFFWTGRNDFFLFSDDKIIAVGGGGHYALIVDSEFLRGSSSPCATFDNPVLASSEDFIVKTFQVWGFEEDIW
ncbi:unnamed protein product [Vitrella brassicaformis CCMP3155]|uniref:Oxidation resistance protein 1 n=2 Tax=Vitrella brassicaformis TaxID=1169539 RepID=A0A0G4EW66_VITBC|nr:unnamed protein product [Vitrella brassicaformis CCMP3155]|eukprot:CEM03192.1 unnamed protein product [Vitrella brassicaformis CCMP3155]